VVRHQGDVQSSSGALDQHAAEPFELCQGECVALRALLETQRRCAHTVGHEAMHRGVRQGLFDPGQFRLKPAPGGEINLAVRVVRQMPIDARVPRRVGLRVVQRPPVAERFAVVILRFHTRGGRRAHEFVQAQVGHRGKGTDHLTGRMKQSKLPARVRRPHQLEGNAVEDEQQVPGRSVCRLVGWGKRVSGLIESRGEAQFANAPIVTGDFRIVTAPVAVDIEGARRVAGWCGSSRDGCRGERAGFSAQTPADQARGDDQPRHLKRDQIAQVMEQDIRGMLHFRASNVHPACHVGPIPRGGSAWGDRQRDRAMGLRAWLGLVNG
jgi:hypothetical protein